MLHRVRDIWPCIAGIVLAVTLDVKSARCEFDGPRHAVDYCRPYTGTIKLSDDGTILCFDGAITADRNTAAFHELKQNGFFVVRSPGGYAAIGIVLSEILLDKNATVIIYDYCLSGCANYFGSS